MAKLTAWLVTLLGLLLVFVANGTISLSDSWVLWVVALVVLIIGIAKLVRNYSGKKK